jgi:hypothetical protein
MRFNIIYLGVAVALTAIVTAITCHRQIARKKPPPPWLYCRYRWSREL